MPACDRARLTSTMLSRRCPWTLSQKVGFSTVCRRLVSVLLTRSRKGAGYHSRRMSGCRSVAHLVRPTWDEMWNMKPARVAGKHLYFSHVKRC